MPKYQNGRVPSSALVNIEGNPYHFSSPYAAHQWIALRNWVKKEYGVTLHITAGKNAYRDLAGQETARKNACNAGNCLGAATPGTSSHGGTWKNWKYTNGVEVDAMAFDIGDWAQLKQDTWYAAARKFGFTAGAITPDIAGGFEPWHIIMFNPWRAIPVTYPSFPLKAGYYFGPRNPIWNIKSVSGYFSHNADLKKWQTQAKAKGFYKGTIDGHYGPQTKAAALALQAKNKLTRDGKIGPNTWKYAWIGPHA